MVNNVHPADRNDGGKKETEMKDKLIAAMKTEVEMIERSYKLELESARNIVESYSRKAPHSHCGHGLAAVAGELAALAGKMDEALRVLNFLEKEQA